MPDHTEMPMPRAPHRCSRSLVALAALGAVLAVAAAARSRAAGRSPARRRDLRRRLLLVHGAAVRQGDGVRLDDLGLHGRHDREPDLRAGRRPARTGHAEAVQVTYDPAKVSYEQLLDVFWRNIDPTDAGGQFCDRGSQYRTGDLRAHAEQKKLAEASQGGAARNQQARSSADRDRDHRRRARSTPAEDYHQDYYKKNPVHYHGLLGRLRPRSAAREVVGQGSRGLAHARPRARHWSSEGPWIGPRPRACASEVTPGQDAEPAGGGGMIISSQEDLTANVLEVMARTPDPRLREITTALVRHLHAFVREVKLTEHEFREAVAHVAALGQQTTESHNEVVLMAGSLGVSTLVCLLNNGNNGQTETSANLLGPFWRLAFPARRERRLADPLRHAGAGDARQWRGQGHQPAGR